MVGEGKRLRINILSFVRYHAILQFILELLEVSAVPMLTIIKEKNWEISLFFQFIGKQQYNICLPKSETNLKFLFLMSEGGKGRT